MLLLKPVEQGSADRVRFFNRRIGNRYVGFPPNKRSLPAREKGPDGSCPFIGAAQGLVVKNSA